MITIVMELTGFDVYSSMLAFDYALDNLDDKECALAKETIAQRDRYKALWESFSFSDQGDVLAKARELA